MCYGSFHLVTCSVISRSKQDDLRRNGGHSSKCPEVAVRPPTCPGLLGENRRRVWGKLHAKSLVLHSGFPVGIDPRGLVSVS